MKLYEAMNLYKLHTKPEQLDKHDQLSYEYRWVSVITSTEDLTLFNLDFGRTTAPGLIDTIKMEFGMPLSEVLKMRWPELTDYDSTQVNNVIRDTRRACVEWASDPEAFIKETDDHFRRFLQLASEIRPTILFNNSDPEGFGAHLFATNISKELLMTLGKGA